MTGTTSSTLNQPKKRQSRLDQVLSSRPAIDHDSQPSPTPSLATATPQKRRNQQLHLLSNHFTPTKNTRSANSSSSVTPKKSNSKSTTPSSSKKQKTTPKSNKKSKSSISRTHPAQLAEDDEQDELISDSDSIGLDQDNNNDVQLPATPASSISTASESPFNLLELIQAGKVEETPRRGRRVGKVNMGWVSPSTRLQKGNQKESLLNSGGKGKAKGKGKRKAVSHQTDDDDDDDDDDYTPQLSGRKSEEPVRIPSWTAPTSTPSKRKQLEEPSTPPIPISASKYNATNAYGVTLIDSQGWAAAGVLGKGERVPYLGSPAQDGMVGLGIGQGDDQLLPSQDSLQSDDLFNSSSDQANKFQLPTQLQPSYDPLSGFSFNNNDSGSPAPVCLKPQEAGRGEGLGTKLIPFQVSGIGRMALHEELVFNFDFLNDNVETSDSNSHGSVPLHRSSDAEGSTSGSSGISGSSNSTNLTSVGTPGPADGSSAPLSGPSPSFSLCSHFPASEPRTPMNAGVKVAPTQETTHQALAAVLKFGAQEPAKEAVTLGSLKLKNAPSAQTIKKLQEVRELVEKSREANRKRKLEVEQSTSSLQEDSSNKRPKHSLRFVGVDTDYVALTLPSLAWPNSDASTPWSSNSHAVNAGQAEKESIMKWLEMKPSTLPVSSSEYEIDAEQRAELEENQLQWSQHPMVAKALRDRARKEEARRILELELAREQRARDRAYGRASARSHAKKAGSHYPKVRRAARASVRQRARKELKAHPDALDGVSASKHRHKPSGAYLIQPPAPVYDPSPEPQVSTTPDAPNAKGKRSQRISVKTKRGASKGKGKEKASESSSTSADAVFGCSCGKTDDDDDTPPMVQCDSCNKWHHLPCIGVESEDQLDAEWYCDACCNPQAVVADEEDANSVATDPLDLELEQRSPASESSFNVLSTPKTHASTPTSASNRFLNGHRLAEPVFAQPMESPMRNMRQPLAASALALAPSPPMMSSSRYRGPPSHLVQDSQSNSQFPQSSVYASPGYHPHAHQREDERYGRGRVRAERIGGWLNMENSEAQDSERRKEEEDLNEQGSPLARKSTPIKRGEDLFSSQPQSQSHQDLEDSRKVSTSAQPISRPRTPTTPRLADKEGQEGLRSPVMGLSTPSRHARFEKRSNHHFSDDEDHSAHRDDVFSTPSRLMGGSASWGYSRGAPGGSASRAGSQTPGKSSLPTFSRDMFGDASGSGHQRRDSSQWGLPSALRTPSRDIVSRGSGSFTPNLGVDHSGGYSVGLPSLVFSSGGLDMDSHPPSYSNHPSSSSDYHHHHPSSSSSTSRAWQLQSPTSTTRAGAARARQSSASYAHSLGLGTPGGMLRTPELQPTFNRGASNNSSIRGTSHHSKSRANGRERERERSRSPSPTKRSKNGSEEMTLPSLKKSSGKTKRRNAQDSEDEEDHSSQAPNSSSPFPPTPTFEGEIRRLESSMDDSRIPSSARKLANLAGGGNSTPLSKSYSQPGFNFTRTPPSEESNRLALSALLDSPADLGSQNRKRNASGLGIGLALDDVLDWS